MTRICRAHDADDAIEGRICGHTMPCPDHPRGWQGVRIKQTPESRTRKNTIFTLSEKARERLREMAEEQGRPASRVLEDLILTKR